MNISICIEIFKENEMYVVLSSELNVSSFGSTIEEAKQSFKEAIQAFIDECKRMGTFEEVLEEARFIRAGDTWICREPVVKEMLPIAI